MLAVPISESPHVVSQQPLKPDLFRSNSWIPATCAVHGRVPNGEPPEYPVSRRPQAKHPSAQPQLQVPLKPSYSQATQAPNRPPKLGHIQHEFVVHICPKLAEFHRTSLRSPVSGHVREKITRMLQSESPMKVDLYRCQCIKKANRAS